ncbi:MAG: AMP-binding protein, partial [Lacipirellulaceae bacterium]
MNICEHLTAAAKRLPDKEAIVFEGQSFSFAQLEQLSAQAAMRLSEAGVGRGDRVAIMLPNVPAFVVWYYASLRLGAITVSISTRLTEKEVAFVVSDCEATAFVADTETIQKQTEYLPDCVAKTFGVSDWADQCNGEKLKDSPDGEISDWIDADPDEAALILYTSGTTGFAKGATLSHNNVRSNVLEFNRLCDMQPDDRILIAVPLFHCFGQNALLNSAFNVG